MNCVLGAGGSLFLTRFGFYTVPVRRCQLLVTDGGDVLDYQLWHVARAPGSQVAPRYFPLRPGALVTAPAGQLRHLC